MSDHGDVLLVEDEPIVSVVLGRYLEEGGYRVHRARSGEEALQAITDEAEGVRLVVTDLRMQGMSGLELARELVRRYPEIRVLFIAGQPWDGEDELPGPLLLKPFTAAELVGAVARLLSESPGGQSLTADPQNRR
jgi:two-component system cell cycle sensor histidine kinase/response regulator CckA